MTRPDEETAADPIDAAVARLSAPPMRGDLPRLLRAFLLAELAVDSKVRLEQAGDRSGHRTFLADVFVDLQAGPPQRQGEPQVRVGRSRPLTRERMVQDRWRWPFDVDSDEEDDSEALPPALLSKLAGVPNRPFRRGPAGRDEVPGALLLTGGPGWGKSTLGQMLCQVHRAILLSAGAAPAAAVKIADRTLDAASAFEIAPAEARFPLRLVLSDFADWLAENRPAPREAVPRYVAARVMKRVRVAGLDADVLRQDLRSLIREMPSLFVFDGLDEVAGTAGRPEVLAALHPFLADLEADGAPALVLLTSRPAAVPLDLPAFVEWRIRPLSRARALRQASHLVGVRHKNDQDRLEQVAARLVDAWESETIRPLLQVPLHVAFTVVLVEGAGRLPEERWRLYDEHYRVLYQRELEKPTEAADILRDNRALIDAVHQRAGLLLQVEAEREGGSRSLLSRERLADIVQTVLENDIDEPERSAFVARVMEAATDRLVMLTRLEEGPDRYGFELRSIQEHFAAEAMFVGREAHVTERLRRIAFAPAFRNVLLIAASKIDARPELWHLRASITDLCALAGAQTGEDPPAVVQCAELALDLLEDGFLRRSKKLSDRLVEAALRMLALPPHAQLLRMTWTLFGRAEQALRARLEEMASGAAPTSMAFWLAVVELAESGVDWAVALGDAHWPAGGAPRRAIVEAAVRHWHRLGSWLGRKIGTSPASFPPSFVHSILGGFVYVEINAGDLPRWLDPCFVRLWESRLGFLFQHFSLRVPFVVTGGPPLQLQLVRSTRVAVQFEVRTEGVASSQETAHRDERSGGAVATDSPEVETISVQDLAVPAIPSIWYPFAVAVAFGLAPSPQSLAAALGALASVEDREALRWAEPWMPWVLRMCLRHARTPEEMRVLASSLVKDPSLLGSEEDWIRAEEAWSSGITTTPLAPAGWPPRAWDGTWFPSEAASVAGDRWSGWKPAQIAELFKGAFPVAQWRLGPLAARLALAGVLEVAYHGESLAGLLEPAQLEEVVELSEITSFAPATILPLGVEHAEHAGWPVTLDRIARRLPVAPIPAGHNAWFAEYLARHWSADPSRIGLLRWVADMVDSGWLPPAGLSEAIVEYDSSQARFDAWALRLVEGFSEADAPGLARQLAADAGRFDPAMFAELGAGIGMRKRCSPGARGAFALTLLRSLPQKLEAYPWGIFALRLLVQEPTGPSGLDDRAVWTALDLPLPLPWRPPSAPPPRVAASRIQGVRLRHVRGLEDLALPIPADTGIPTGGRWIVLLGENGVGKSTILRAVTLALLDPSLAAALVKASPAGYVAHDRDTASVEVTIPGRPLTVTITRDGTGIETLSTTDEPRPLVFAYGCRRSSALGGAARALSFAPNDRIATLFDEGADLIHAETWLKSRAFAAVENSRERVLLDEVKKALLRAMPGILTIDVKADGVWLYGPAVGRTRLAGLSDGYLTMMGWIVDLIARWTEMEERKKHVIEPSFMEQMEGVVLLDELDLHLHPRWQMRVIEDLRELFPRMTFVVTTHNPLTLLGAREGEVIVLRRAERKENGDAADRTAVLAERRDLRPGLTTDQILTGAWFGLSSTLDQGTLDLIERHAALLREGRGDEDPERLALERELRLRLGRFADTSIERLAQRVAAELSPRGAMELSPEEREALRAKIRETVAAERAAARKLPEKR